MRSPRRVGWLRILTSSGLAANSLLADARKQAIHTQAQFVLGFDPARDFNLVRLDETLVIPRQTSRWHRVTDHVTFQQVSNVWVPMAWQYTCAFQSGNTRQDLQTSTSRVRRTRLLLHPDHDALGSFLPPGEVRDGWGVRLRGFGGQFTGLTNLVWKSGRVVNDQGRTVFDGRPTPPAR